jgi:hypothetical protein
MAAKVTAPDAVTTATTTLRGHPAAADHPSTGSR